jgi:hypothetical protein
MPRYTVAAALAALAVASVLPLTLASARGAGPGALSIRSSSIGIGSSNAADHRWPHQYYPNYNSNIFGLGTGGLGGSSACPPSICGRPHPQAR